MSSDDLFEDLPADPSVPPSPPAGGERASLAERMRPRTLDELAGQPELFAPGAPLRRAIEADTLGSALVWGPPGSGKTTLARLVQAGSRLPFRTLSAVRSGLPELRRILDEAETLWTRRGTPLRLFIDEIHRYHKGQQDALLPAVESGAVRLLGATTENPSYGINPALVSRCQVFELAPLAGETLAELLGRALADPERGLGREDLLPAHDALDLVARLAEGDARSALNLLEWAVQGLDAGEPLGPDQVSRASRRRPPAYDRDGEGRYQTISALHKSVRGSDPQATLYWLARMVDGGEDPVYIARRLIRMASEDIGLADPQGLVQAIAARDACEHLGLPECALALAQAALYLALAPKSNSLETGWQAAMAAVKSRGALPVPTEFRNAVTAFDRRRGIGAGYRYDHDEKDGYSGQDHLPEALRGHAFWSPVERGFERDLRRRLEWFESRREKPGRAAPPGGPLHQEPGP